MLASAERPRAQPAPKSRPRVHPARQALVVFEDRDEGDWLKYLRPGFRHCFCVLGTGDVWTIIDPLKSKIELAICTGVAPTDLAHRYHATGRQVLVGTRQEAPINKTFLPRPLTCVEIVKRLLDLDAPAVLTPWQLYRTLAHEHGFQTYRPGTDAMDTASETLDVAPL